MALPATGGRLSAQRQWPNNHPTNTSPHCKACRTQTTISPTLPLILPRLRGSDAVAGCAIIVCIAAGD